MGSTGSLCCVALTALLGQQKVAVPGSPAYTESLGSYFSQQEAAVQPACIVLPESASDVSQTVVALQHERCPFAVRSCGHTAWAGAANIADGVVIDLRRLDAIELSADQSTVSVGVGASWDMVYARLDPLGLSVNGGRAAGVGVGGLCLGGGISYFSPRYGWTCDTVTNYQIVLADGAIVNANTKSNPDLFQALKGGNNNFGVVTQVELTTFEQGNVWAATVYNDLSLVDEVIAEFVKLNSPTAYDEYASLITAFGYSQARDLAVISSNLEYTKPVENPPVYEAYLALPSLMSKSEITNLTNLSFATQALQPNGARSFSLVTTLVSSAPVIKAAYEAWKASLPAVKDIPNIVYALALEPLPPIFYSRHASTNALGLEDRTASLIVVLISVTWFTSEHDLLVSETSQSLLDEINAAAAKLGGLDPYIYLNYAGQDQDPIASYGAKSVSQLQQVRARVDPNKVFTDQVPGGYKIPSS
ncbi:CAZyme family AA7 [Paecilomyces variotii]|nr:CAZyme family AA7 [Paecilomyces variotii]KAJ9328008.1 CAZyme family AA7 [Paecilomyces variotii]KAJ9360268.1 CAZyme family AA7 [Paecilomyces variotii]KAJ9410536.1 CAZyme family AA7 [Paecilomyces variotii]